MMKTFVRPARDLRNNYAELPAALVRPGRIDKKIQIGLPDRTSRAEILKLYAGKTSCTFEMSMEELAKRLKSRGTESDEKIALRIARADYELSKKDKYDYCVVNGLLEEAVSRVKSIIVAEHSRVAEDVRTLIERYEEEI